MKRLLATFLACLALPALAAKDAYTYVRDGGADAATSTSPLVVLMGGGTEVDEAMQRLCEAAGQGDILVIRATGTDAYNPYLRELCPAANSVATLIVPRRKGADDPFVENAVARAEAVWIAGGDQSDYLTEWKGSRLNRALQARIDAGVPVGGTSAGTMVLTQFIYSALGSKGVTSSQALADPYNRYITLDRDFVGLPGGLLAGLIGDTHFAERDRMGRDLAFLCRIAAAGWSSQPRALAIDEQTAVLLGEQGSAEVLGLGSAYFLEGGGSASGCQPGVPLTYTGVSVYRVAEGGLFNVLNWKGTGGAAYSVSAINGVLSSTQAGGSPYGP